MLMVVFAAVEREELRVAARDVAGARDVAHDQHVLRLDKIR